MNGRGVFMSASLKKNPSYHDRVTAIFEFARGVEHGGMFQLLNKISVTTFKNSLKCFGMMGCFSVRGKY